MKKKWYLSKTILAAIATGVIGVLTALGITVPPLILTVLAALGIYGRVSASADIE